MARISLEQLLKKGTGKLVQQLIESAGTQLSITDSEGKQLLSTLPQVGPIHTIEIAEQKFGQVQGESAHAGAVAQLIQHLLQQDVEKKTLGNEVLSLYREINLIYNFSEKLADSIDPAAVAKLALEEAFQLNRATGACVTLMAEADAEPLVFAQIGQPFFSSTSLSEGHLLRQITQEGKAGIQSDANGIASLEGSAFSVKALMYAPLRVKQRLVGAIILAHEEAIEYTAAELKLLTTLALQSAAAIESALLFDRGIKEVQQREESIRRINEATTRFVPNEFVRSLGFDHITEVTLGDNVEKEVTVLFNDIRGYTTLAETMTPTENFKFVNAFHGRMGPFIQEHEGFINQYLGDAIMALFPNGSDQALLAAISMQQELQRYNQQRVRRQRQAIRMGIGLHTGPLIMGIIGDQNRLDAATIADSVNTSSRIESLTKHFGVSILLSEESLKKLEHPEQFHTRYLGQVLVKGKNEPIGVYECFDGDEPRAVEWKQKALADFEQGLALYYQRAFHDAAEAFNRALKKNPDDLPSRLFLYKSVDLIEEGVAEDWTGVEVIVFK